VYVNVYMYVCARLFYFNKFFFVNDLAVCVCVRVLFHWVLWFFTDFSDFSNNVKLISANNKTTTNPFLDLLKSNTQTHMRTIHTQLYHSINFAREAYKDSL